jgi:hypothetical protein
MPRAADIRDHIEILRIAWYFGSKIREDRSARRWLQSRQNRPTLRPFITRIQQKSSFQKIQEYQIINGLTEFVEAVCNQYGHDQQKLYSIARTPLAFEEATFQPNAGPAQAGMDDAGLDPEPPRDAIAIVRCISCVYPKVYLIDRVRDWLAGDLPAPAEFISTLRQLPELAGLEEVKFLNGLDVFIKAFSRLSGRDPAELRSQAHSDTRINHSPQSAGF